MRRVHRAWREAEQVLEKHRVRRAPVDVRALAEHYARVVERPLDPDISGALIPLDTGGWVILVNESHPQVRRRFTIAHELGHMLLHGYTTAHADRSFKFRDTRSSAGSALDEIQANQFAAELLMPRELVLKSVRSRSLEHAPEINSAEDDAEFDRWLGELAHKFDVSKQAMSIRLSSLFA